MKEKPEEEKVRIDKWLWSVRIYKTRSQATEACRSGKVFVNNEPAKPGRTIRPGEIVVVKKTPVWYTYEVKALTEKRLPAPLAAEHYRNLTPEEELNKLNITRLSGFEYREKGCGRPTKRERREINRLKKLS
ncbi:MAG TPA: RNA-binding S4 domain-containing protein [Bacteroidetes bacterium]|nr:RNA-binding S4 domain-containing protein [Bacteroidota bacterium]